MPKIKLNEKIIAKLAAPAPSGKDTLYWDLDLKGFGVRCSGKTNAKMYIVQRDLPGGKSRRVNVGAVNGLSLAEARVEARNLLHEMRKGIDPKAKAALVPTLQSWLERYLEFRSDLRPGSVVMYRTIERTLKPWMNLQLHEITGDMVVARHRELAKIIKRGRYTGNSTANFAMKTLRAIWNFAADRTANLPANPVRLLKRGMFPEPRRTRYVTAEQLPAFYHGVKDCCSPITRDYIYLLLFTGLRRREAASLRWTDIDLKEQMIRLPATSTKADRKLDLPMSDFVFGLLVARRNLGNAGYVFPGHRTNQHISDNIKMFAAIEKATGIKVSAHDLRRTFATVAGNTEISPFALKALLNHSVGNDVTAGYIVAMPELRAAAQKVCDRMKMLCSISEIAGENVARMK